MMQMDRVLIRVLELISVPNESSSISGFDSGFRAHFRFELVLRFIYFNKFQHFVHIEGEC